MSANQDGFARVDCATGRRSRGPRERMARKLNLPIRGRDVILAVDDHPTPDLKTLSSLLEKPGQGVPWAARAT